MRATLPLAHASRRARAAVLLASLTALSTTVAACKDTTAATSPEDVRPSALVADAGEPGRRQTQSGVAGVHVVADTVGVSAAFENMTLDMQVSCPTGEVATGGGFDGADLAELHRSVPLFAAGSTTPTGWKVRFFVGPYGGYPVVTYVICMPGR